MQQAPSKQRGPRPRSTRALVALLAFVLGVATVPHRVCERDARGWFDGDAARTRALATSVARWTETELAPQSFATGSARFDGEWLFGTYMMAAMGFGQTVLEHPEARDESLERMERCLDAMLAEGARRFDAAAWNEDALASVSAEPGSARDRGHVAYLGYAGLALGLHRMLRPSSRFDAQHDAIAAALERRIEASKTGFVETYPGEVYPVDNTAALGAVALHARSTRRPPPPALARGLEAMRRHAVDPKSGLLVQAVSADDASPRDAARGSGTALAAYFLAFADEAASADLWRALAREQFRTVLGFGVMLEHHGDGHADIDSGPVVFGFGVSATGFAIGASRVHGDRETFASLYATAHLFGAPFDRGGTRTYATGGPIGDAILFAMVTAPRAGRLS